MSVNRQCQQTRQQTHSSATCWQQRARNNWHHQYDNWLLWTTNDHVCVYYATMYHQPCTQHVQHSSTGVVTCPQTSWHLDVHRLADMILYHCHATLCTGSRIQTCWYCVTQTVSNCTRLNQQLTAGLACCSVNATMMTYLQGTQVWHVLTSQFHLSLTRASTDAMSHACLYSAPWQHHHTFDCYSLLVPLRVGGWVGQGSWLYTKVVCPSEDGHSSQY